MKNFGSSSSNQNGGRTHNFERKKIDTANKDDFSGIIKKNKKYILQI